MLMDVIFKIKTGEKSQGMMSWRSWRRVKIETEDRVVRRGPLGRYTEQRPTALVACACVEKILSR